MRDILALVIALGLLALAASLATTLRFYRQRQRTAREAQRAQGRTIIAELPTSEDLVLFSEDDACFHYGDKSIEKHTIAAARVLIDGAPIVQVFSRRYGHRAAATPASFEDRPEGIARDRWDVAIDTISKAAEPGSAEAPITTVLVECGAIRERVSQELARSVFEAVKRSITTPFPEARPGD
jgi:hypothetical protein